MVDLLPDAEINDIVSHLPGVVASVRAEAAKGGARAQAVLAAHHHTGAAQIVVDHGPVDAFVSLDDTRGDHAAAAIEYGRSGGRGGATQGINALGSAF